MLRTITLVLAQNGNAKEERQTTGGKLGFQCAGNKITFCSPFAFEGKQLLLGRRPKPALLFLIAEKEGKKASPLGTYKTYFEPGVLQLPTVKQIKRLYNSVQNRFYKQVQKGAFNGTQQNGNRKTAKIKAENYKKPHCLIGGLVGER